MFERSLGNEEVNLPFSDTANDRPQWFCEKRQTGNTAVRQTNIEDYKQYEQYLEDMQQSPFRLEKRILQRPFFQNGRHPTPAVFGKFKFAGVDLPGQANHRVVNARHSEPTTKVPAECV